MNCGTIEPLLGAWLAGEIRPEERADAEAHLLDCAGCRADFELARIGMRVEWPAETAPKVPRTRPPRLVTVLKLGTAAALLLAALAMAGRRDPPRPAPVQASFSDGTLGAILVRDEDGRPQGDLRLQEHRVSVEILDGVALTTVEENFENLSDRRLEGTFRFPLPQDAAISRLALEVNGKMEEGTCLERERAREVFESIVRRQKDPALLEWLPGGIFQCRIFPIEPHSTKRVIVGYTQVLPFRRGRLRYAYPLASEKTREFPPGLLSIDVRARFSGTLSALSSPTHRLDVQRRDVHEASASFRASHLRPKDDFVVELETADDEVRVVAHREDGEDGYVAVFVAPRLAEARAPRRYALLVDASASVSAPAFEAAGKVVDALRAAAIPGDRVEVSWFNVDVERTPVRPLGGCDLLKALRSVDADETILIGECTPTLGETDRAAIVESMKARRIRTIAIGSQLDTGLLEKLGPVAVIAPGEDVARRAAEIASTLGAPVVRNLRIEGPVTELVGARDVFAGERVLLAARYAAAGAPVTLLAEGWRRVVEVPESSGNAWVKRLWAQRRVSDLLAAGGPREQVVALGVKHQIMTPYTSFLVLETEQMWKDFQLERTVGKREQLLGKLPAEAAATEVAVKREVTRKIAHLLELAFMAHDQKRYDRGIKLLDEILLIDPHYAVAREFKEDLEKTRHKEEYTGVLAQKVERWKRLTDDDDEAVIPFSQTLRFPSRDEWAEVSKRLTEAVIKTEGGPSDEQARAQRKVYLSWQHYDQALRFHNRGEFERAKIEAQKALQSFHENLEARKLLNDIHQRTVGGRPEFGARGADEGASREFRVRVEQAQIEITKNVRDGERFLNARMYDKAIKEFQDADFKIRNIPYEVRPMRELLPLVRESAVKARNARMLEDLRMAEFKRREAESEAVATARPPKGISALEEEDAVDSWPDVRAGTPGWTGGGDRAQVFDRGLDERLVDLVSGTAGGGGPLSGATFALTEPGTTQAWSERLARDLAELEAKHVEMAREKKLLEEKINAIALAGGNSNVAPRKTLEAKVTAIANEIGLVVISIGKDDGVLEGDEFTVFRGGDFVAKVKIDRADRRWSAGKVVLKKMDPRVADDASNHIYVAAPQSTERKVVEVTPEGGVVFEMPLPEGERVVALRDGRYVAMLRVVGPGKAQSWLEIQAGVVQVGDLLEPLRTREDALRWLPSDVWQDLASRAAAEGLRVRLEAGR